jgi:hypothetical protein
VSQQRAVKVWRVGATKPTPWLYFGHYLVNGEVYAIYGREGEPNRTYGELWAEGLHYATRAEALAAMARNN